MTQFIIALFEGITLGGTYALIGLGIVVIFRGTDTLNFAHGEFMLLGAYLVAVWQGARGTPELIVFLGSVAFVALFGAVLFGVVLRRIIGLSPFIGVIATLGVASVADGVMSLVFGTQQYGISYSWLPSGSIVVLSARIQSASLVVAGISFFVACLLALVLRVSSVGAKLRASGQDSLLASQSGINVHRMHTLCWALGGGLAALAGISYGATNIVTPDITSIGLVAFPAVMLGGLDSVEGSLIGGVLIGLAEALTVSYLGGQWADIGTYTVLLIVLLVRPTGLFGTERVVRV